MAQRWGSGAPMPNEGDIGRWYLFEEGESAFDNGVDSIHMNIYVAKLDSRDYNNKNKTVRIWSGWVGGSKSRRKWGKSGRGEYDLNTLYVYVYEIVQELVGKVIILKDDYYRVPDNSKWNVHKLGRKVSLDILCLWCAFKYNTKSCFDSRRVLHI